MSRGSQLGSRIMTVIPALFVVLSSVPANGPRTTRSDLSSERGGVILEWREIPELGITSDVMITPIPRNLLPCFKVRMRTGLFCTRERVPGIETELHSSLVEMR